MIYINVIQLACTFFLLGLASFKMIQFIYSNYKKDDFDDPTFKKNQKKKVNIIILSLTLLVVIFFIGSFLQYYLKH